MERTLKATDRIGAVVVAVTAVLGSILGGGVLSLFGDGAANVIVGGMLGVLLGALAGFFVAGFIQGLTIGLLLLKQRLQ